MRGLLVVTIAMMIGSAVGDELESRIIRFSMTIPMNSENLPLVRAPRPGAIACSAGSVSRHTSFIDQISMPVLGLLFCQAAGHGMYGLTEKATTWRLP